MGGRPVTSRTQQDREDREDTMDWTALGKLATGICRRPPTMGFMLGPLSLEKKERKTTRRQNERKDNSAIVRPQEVCLPA